MLVSMVPACVQHVAVANSYGQQPLSLICTAASVEQKQQCPPKIRYGRILQRQRRRADTTTSLEHIICLLNVTPCCRECREDACAVYPPLATQIFSIYVTDDEVIGMVLSCPIEQCMCGYVHKQTRHGLLSFAVNRRLKL